MDVKALGRKKIMIEGKKRCHNPLKVNTLIIHLQINLENQS